MWAFTDIFFPISIQYVRRDMQYDSITGNHITGESVGCPVFEARFELKQQRQCYWLLIVYRGFYLPGSTSCTIVQRKLVALQTLQQLPPTS